MRIFLLFIVIILIFENVNSLTFPFTGIQTRSKCEERKEYHGVCKLNRLLAFQNNGHKKDTFELDRMIPSVALISGTAVGAGVLALPAFTRSAGVIPSSIALIFCWAVMTAAGLLLAEVVLSAHNKSKMEVVDNPNVNLGILSLARLTLGDISSIGVGVVYLFLHYSLLVAYIAEGGIILGEALSTGENVGQALFVAALAAVLTGSERTRDNVNDFFAAVTVTAFVILIVLGLPAVRLDNLMHQDVGLVWETLPVMLLALVFHNVVPVVCKGLLFDPVKVRNAILLGSSIPLLMFLLWNFTVLGLDSSFGDAAQGVSFDPVVTFASSVEQRPGLVAITGNEARSLVAIFSESAIITSFIGFAVGLTDFYRDLWPQRDSRDPAL